jgi:hypothetical protein
MAGTLDTSFGYNGIVINSFFNNNSLYCQLLTTSIQNGNKLILAGSAQNPNNLSNTSFGLARYNLDGSLDTSFGSFSNGFEYYECSGNQITTTYVGARRCSSSLAFDNSGNIIIGGSTSKTNVSNTYEFYISRFTSEGIIDPTFSAVPIVFFPSTNSVGVTPLVSSSGNILLTGYAEDDITRLNLFSIACYNNNGSLNTSWGISGTNAFFINAPSQVGIISTCAALQTISGTEYAIMAGYIVDASDNPLQFAMLRVNASTGDLDTTFGTVGASYTSFTDVSGCGAQSIVITPDNKILLGGFIINSDGSNSFSMVKFTSNGIVDTSFGTNGNGRVDSSFQNSSPDGGGANSIVLQTDQKIILGGFTSNSVTSSSDYALVRYNPNGTIDTSFGTNGYTQTNLFSTECLGFSLAIQNDNKILLTGSVYFSRSSPFGPTTTNFEIGIARYLYTSITCFKEDTKILCLKGNEEKYLPIQDLRSGDLVKTSLNGYVKIDMIGKSTIYNPGNDKRIKERLYQCSKENYQEIFEDLYITGCHSILVDNLTEEEREKTMELMNDIYVTDRKYRLMACVDKRALPYQSEGTFNIYHMALENDNYYMNYGIYANGLLVETTSKRWLKELSDMDLL